MRFFLYNIINLKYLYSVLFIIRRVFRLNSVHAHLMFVFPFLFFIFLFRRSENSCVFSEIGRFLFSKWAWFIWEFLLFRVYIFALIAFVLPRPNSVFKYFSVELALTFLFYLFFYSFPENASVNSHIKAKLRDTVYLLSFFSFKIFSHWKLTQRTFIINNFHEFIEL